MHDVPVRDYDDDHSHCSVETATTATVPLETTTTATVSTRDLHGACSRVKGQRPQPLFPVRDNNHSHCSVRDYDNDHTCSVRDHSHDPPYCPSRDNDHGLPVEATTTMTGCCGSGRDGRNTYARQLRQLQPLFQSETTTTATVLVETTTTEDVTQHSCRICKLTNHRHHFQTEM